MVSVTSSRCFAAEVTDGFSVPQLTRADSSLTSAVLATWFPVSFTSTTQFSSRKDQVSVLEPLVSGPECETSSCLLCCSADVLQHSCHLDF